MVINSALIVLIGKTGSAIIVPPEAVGIVLVPIEPTGSAVITSETVALEEVSVGVFEAIGLEVVEVSEVGITSTGLGFTIDVLIYGGGNVTPPKI
jgi:hypothetical protein